MRDLRQRFPDELVVIGVHSAKFLTEQITENIREAVIRHDIRHPVVNDAGFDIWQQYGVRAWPTVIVIDPAGKIVDTKAGEIEAQEYIPMIERLIADFESQGLLDRSPLDLKAEAAGEPVRPLNYPSKIFFTPDGRCFIADTGHHRILELRLNEENTTAEVVHVYGNGRPGLIDGPAGTASFNNPRGMAFLNNTLYVADTDNHAVRAIGLETGTVRTVAGNGRKGAGRVAGERPTDISLRSPWALLAMDNATQKGEPVLFIAMAGSHQIWVLLDEAKLGIFAGSGHEVLADGLPAEAGFNQPSDLAFGMNHLLVADSEASAIRAIALSGDLRVFTLVGQGLFEFGDIDGVGAEVRLQHPTGLAYHESLEVASPSVYIADSYNHKIKALDPTVGSVRTLIGSGKPGHADGPFEQAGLFQPEGVAVYNERIYIADTNNHAIRAGDLPTRTVHTLALDGLEPPGMPPVER